MNGTKAKAMRLFLKETQKEFAVRLGVSASTICAIEKECREISDLINARLLHLEMNLPTDFYNFYEGVKGHIKA